jgi:hypothetical protein
VAGVAALSVAVMGISTRWLASDAWHSGVPRLTALWMSASLAAFGAAVVCIGLARVDDRAARWLLRFALVAYVVIAFARLAGGLFDVVPLPSRYVIFGYRTLAPLLGPCALGLLAAALLRLGVVATWIGVLGVVAASIGLVLVVLLQVDLFGVAHGWLSSEVFAARNVRLQLVTYIRYALDAAFWISLGLALLYRASSDGHEAQPVA